MLFSLSTDTAMVVAACAGAIMFGGIVKGTLGVGLPLFAVPMMSLMIGSTQAIALVAVPVLVSNIWQAWLAGNWKASFVRFWPLMLTQGVMTVFAVHWTLSFSARELNALVAFAVVLAVVSMAFKPSFKIPPECRLEKKLIFIISISGKTSWNEELSIIATLNKDAKGKFGGCVNSLI